MYSEQVLDHFRNPRHAGKLDDATAIVQASNPVCGDLVELAVRLDGECIREARFLCRGCTTSIACGSWLAEWLTGKELAHLRSISAEEISAALGGLPPATFHGAQLAAEAMRLLREELR